MGNEAEPRNQLRNKNHELSGRSIDVKQNSDHDHDHEHLNITHNTENKNNTSTTSTTSSTKEKTGLLTKVLVVEDDKGLNLLIQKTLQKLREHQII